MLTNIACSTVVIGRHIRRLRRLSTITVSSSSGGGGGTESRGPSGMTPSSDSQQPLNWFIVHVSRRQRITIGQCSKHVHHSCHWPAQIPTAGPGSSSCFTTVPTQPFALLARIILLFSLFSLISRLLCCCIYRLEPTDCEHQNC